MTAPTPEHFPQPGPDYWSYRCLRCDRPVAEHALRWFTFWRKGWWQR